MNQLMHQCLEYDQRNQQILHLFFFNFLIFLKSISFNGVGYPETQYKTIILS